MTPGPTGLTVPASQTLTITRMTETTPVVTLVSGSGVDLGERRREHGDREAEQSLERGRDRDGLGGAGRSGGGANQVLTITAGQTSSTGAVTITAKNNGVDAPDRRVTVTGAVTGGNGGAALTITDDEETPTVTLALAPTSITENGGVSTVTASLNGLSSADVVVTVSASAVDPAVANDFTLSGNRELTIKAGQMESTGTVAVNRRQQRRRRAEQDRRGDGVGDGRQRRDGAGGADADDRPSSERVTG